MLVGALATAASTAAQDPAAIRETVSAAEAASAGTPAATMQVSPSEVTWRTADDHEAIALTVSGPDGVWVRREFGPGEPPSFSALDEQGSRHPDGSYTYELRTVPQVRRGFDEDLAATRQAGDTERIAELQREITPDRLLVSGSFAIHQGSFVEPATDPGSEPTPPPDGGLRPITAAQHVINDDLVVDGTACIGYACVADSDDTNFNSVRLKGDFLNLIFEDTVGGVTSDRDWLIRTGMLGGDNFEIVDSTSGNTPFFIQGGAPANALSVLSNGNVWVSSGNVGVGTVAPGAKLHLFGFQNTDVFASAGTDPASGPAFNFGYGGASFGRGAGFLNARPDASATAPNPSLRFLTANVERMIITNTGNVGIGTSSPSQKLHVTGSAGTTKALIQETSGTNADREMVEIQNFGGAAIIFKNTAVTQRWSANGSVNFILNNQTNPGIEFTLDPVGNLAIAGTLTQGSSRTIKEGFSALDPRELLHKVLALPITSWSYQQDPGVRHIGPMSEDFYAAFAVGGDDQGISVTDSAGVALAAIQGLHQELAARDARIAALQEQLAAVAGLQAQFAEIAARLEALEAKP